MAERPINIMRSSGSPDPIPLDVQDVIAQVTEYLDSVEQEVLDGILEMLRAVNVSTDRNTCDHIFGDFTGNILVPYSRREMGSRAAFFARTALIPAVLTLEAATGREFHKGALFYDTALAHLIAGDENRFEYFLAMADEEDNRTHQAEGRGASRGTTNLKMGPLSQQTLQMSIGYAADILNGVATGQAITYQLLFGAPVDAVRAGRWRQTLEPFHHFELFRILSELEVFTGNRAPAYPTVLDNPYVMLRLAKVLAHAAQWAESDLTHLQGAGIGTLSQKLAQDGDFNALKTCAGGAAPFCGNMPHGAAFDAEARNLVNGITQTQVRDEQHWRVLRLLYIIRNATAHVIDPALAFHRDRPLLLSLLQAVLLSMFVIRHCKHAPLP